MDAVSSPWSQHSIHASSGVVTTAVTSMSSTVSIREFSPVRVMQVKVVRGINA